MDPVAEFTLAEYNMFDYMPHWIQPLVGTPEERAAKLRDPAARQAMKQDVEKFPHVRTDWHTMIVVQVIQERNRPYEGLTLAELGQKQGKHPLDAFLDLALDDGLKTTFSHMLANRGDETLARRITNPYSHISLSDGGAHIRYLTISTWPVHFLSYWVRDKQLLSLEQAHLTDHGPSAALEDGRTLLGEGPHGLLGVFGLGELARHVLLEPVSVPQVHELDGVQGVLGEPDSQRALRGNLGGDSGGGLHEPVGGHALLHDPQPVQLGPGDALARQHETAHLGVGEEPHGVTSPAEQTHVDLRKPEHAVL
jgi:hypothetical protein